MLRILSGILALTLIASSCATEETPQSFADLPSATPTSRASGDRTPAPIQQTVAAAAPTATAAPGGAGGGEPTQLATTPTPQPQAIATAIPTATNTPAPTATNPPPPTNTPVPPTNTPPPPPPPTPTPVPQPVAQNCHSSYPTVCIPPPPPDLDCGDIPFRRFTVVGADPHRFDGDNDGVGCES